MAQTDETDHPDQPAPGSHDRTTPTGSLEESAANLFETMLAARDAEAIGGADDRALRTFYRTLMTSTLLLPVPPEHGEEAKAALAAAVNDDEQVEISVMLARESDGTTVSVVFGSIGASRPGRRHAPATCRSRPGSRSPTSRPRGCRRSWIRPGRFPIASMPTSWTRWQPGAFRQPTSRCLSRRRERRSVSVSRDRYARSRNGWPATCAGRA